MDNRFFRSITLNVAVGYFHNLKPERIRYFRRPVVPVTVRGMNDFREPAIRMLLTARFITEVDGSQCSDMPLVLAIRRTSTRLTTTPKMLTSLTPLTWAAKAVAFAFSGSDLTEPVSTTTPFAQETCKPY